jgi:hypothetical protein
MDTRRIRKIIDRILNPLRIEWYDGFSDLKSLDDNTWKGPSNRGILIVPNPKDKLRNELFITKPSSGFPSCFLSMIK